MSKTANMTVWAQDSFSDDIIPHSFRIFREPVLEKGKFSGYFCAHFYS